MNRKSPILVAPISLVFVVAKSLVYLVHLVPNDMMKNPIWEMTLKEPKHYSNGKGASQLLEGFHSMLIVHRCVFHQQRKCVQPLFVISLFYLQQMAWQLCALVAFYLSPQCANKINKKILDISQAHWYFSRGVPYVQNETYFALQNIVHMPNCTKGHLHSTSRNVHWHFKS